jgi:DNA-directed RNA polymerase specialized sigma24 family protein
MAERPRDGDSPRGGPRGAAGRASGSGTRGGKGAGKRPVKGAATGAAKGAAKGAADATGPREEPDVRTQIAAPLARVLQRLPATQRKVLELRMGLADGHPHDPADAARILGISLGELREIEARAFERIREVIPLQQLQRFLER